MNICRLQPLSRSSASWTDEIGSYMTQSVLCSFGADGGCCCNLARAGVLKLVSDVVSHKHKAIAICDGDIHGWRGRQLSNILMCRHMLTCCQPDDSGAAQGSAQLTETGRNLPAPGGSPCNKASHPRPKILACRVSHSWPLSSCSLHMQTSSPMRVVQDIIGI